MKANGDIVNHPQHYTQGEVECIQAIRAALGPEGYLAYCRGIIIKYVWRCMYKGATEVDLRKAKWYSEEACRVAAQIGKTAEKIPSMDVNYGPNPALLSIREKGE